MSHMIIDYWNFDNTAPVLSFMAEQPPQAGAKIQKIIDFFETDGMALLGPKYLKKIVGYPELYELRIKWKGFAYRIMVVIRNSVAYLVSGFIKKSEKTPLSEIRIAIQRQAMIPVYC